MPTGVDPAVSFVAFSEEPPSMVGSPEKVEVLVSLDWSCFILFLGGILPTIKG